MLGWFISGCLLMVIWIELCVIVVVFMCMFELIIMVLVCEFIIMWVGVLVGVMLMFWILFSYVIFCDGFIGLCMVIELLLMVLVVFVL